MAAKLTIRKETAAVLVNATGGDSLLYRVTVIGPDPIFALVDSNANLLLLSNNDVPLGGNVWSRTWPKPADPVTVSSSHTMGFSFLDAIKYTYLVEHHRRNKPVEVLIDIDYESSHQEPAFFQRLGVTTF